MQDNDTIDRQEANRADRNARLMSYIIALIVAAAFVLQRFAPPAPPQPLYYRPDPTPYVVETTRVEILSNNRFCVGVFDHC